MGTSEAKSGSMEPGTLSPAAVRVLDRYRRLCSMREYCSSEVLTKVRKALGEEAAGSVAEEIVALLVKDRYVDDRRYAEAFARDKSSLAGWGEVKIRFMLRGKGIPDSVIREALAEIDPGRADERLRKLAETKFKALVEDPQCKLKLLRYLLGRGYQYGEAAPVVDALMKRTKE